MIERPLLLWLAPVAAAGVGLLAWWARQVRMRAAAAWSPDLAARARASGAWSAPVLGTAALLILVGMAGPRWGLASRAAESRAINVVLVMDISKSMLAQDVLPDRLGRAIQVARRLVQDLSGDRLGLVAFAARPYLMSPLTLDQSAIALQLDALDPSVASEGGSNLGAALVLAREVLTQASEGGDRAVVVLSDGESFDGEEAAAEAAARLAGDRIALITVPFGSTDGARIPEGDGTWHVDHLGREVITRRGDAVLSAMTEAAGGELVAPDAPDPAGEVRRWLARLDRAAVRDQIAADLVPRGWLFALAALVLVAAHAATRRTAALIGLLLACLPAAASAQRPTDGLRLLQRGDTAAAVPAFLREAKRRGGDTVWYNAGTAALVQGDLATAAEALERATASLDPELRRRALYNLGTTLLRQARADTTARDSLATAAARHLREALTLAPADGAAKYNYELARRLMRPPPPPQGGGGGDTPPPPNQPPQDPSRGEMSESEAEQVLQAMERAERETRQDLARRQRRGASPTGPDW
ncbi:MAG: VWA domain-containing protein [Gemmatimonadales bacterium]